MISANIDCDANIELTENSNRNLVFKELNEYKCNTTTYISLYDKLTNHIYYEYDISNYTNASNKLLEIAILFRIEYLLFSYDYSVEIEAIKDEEQKIFSVDIEFDVGNIWIENFDDTYTPSTIIVKFNDKVYKENVNNTNTLEETLFNLLFNIAFNEKE